uniref:Uncharacterized protein n=1 Tax=Francisella tularensis subsp. novicida PA10-7858 TaxID=1386968 RepID=V5TAX3_FRANO|nr:hypothetical protein [Francisella tularensis]AHB60783.1 hypothetical protein N894_0015 [Francisella tularensis subsp. novicida PA10-7858]
MIAGLMVFCLIGFTVELLLRFRYINIFSYIKARVIFCFLLAILFMFFSSFFDKEALLSIDENNSINILILGGLALFGLIYLAECLTTIVISVINMTTNSIDNICNYFFSKKNQKLTYYSSDGKRVDLKKLKTTLYVSKSSAGKGVSHAEFIN